MIKNGDLNTICNLCKKPLWLHDKFHYPIENHNHNINDNYFNIINNDFGGCTQCNRPLVNHKVNDISDYETISHIVKHVVKLLFTIGIEDYNKIEYMMMMIIQHNDSLDTHLKKVENNDIIL